MSVHRLKPVAGAQIRTLGDRPSDVHVCSVVSLLSTQFVVSYEYQRPDGGWNERMIFLFYKDEGVTWERA